MTLTPLVYVLAAVGGVVVFGALGALGYYAIHVHRENRRDREIARLWLKGEIVWDERSREWVPKEWV